MSDSNSTAARMLRLDEAYQGRAMFVKVQCKVGEAPSQLSHHPELRFRFPPRPVDGAPLIANGVSIQAKDEMELLLRRDRAGCYVCMDEIFVFETTSFDIFCEKERWAAGRLVLEKTTTKTSEGEGEGGGEGGGGAGSEGGAARGETQIMCTWSLELSPSHSALAAGSSPSSEDAASDYSSSTTRQLALELCLVGTCGGRHECMTNETPLQTWKVVSPRSFVQRPSLGAIAEMCADEWSDDEGSLCDLATGRRTSSESGSGSGSGGAGAGGVVPRADGAEQHDDGQHERGGRAAEARGEHGSEVDGDGALSSSSGGTDGVVGGHTGGGGGGGGADGDGGGEGVGAGGVEGPPNSQNSPWSLVPWKGEMSSISPRFDRAEVIRNVRKRYEDLMHEYHATSGSSSGLGSAAEGSEDLFKGDLTWFSAGVRIGVGVGLGVCLGLGLGVGILVNGYKVSRDRLNNMKHAFKYR